MTQKTERLSLRLTHKEFAVLRRAAELEASRQMTSSCAT